MSHQFSSAIRQMSSIQPADFRQAMRNLERCRHPDDRNRSRRAWTDGEFYDVHGIERPCLVHQCLL
ncbi:hypothetical protein [Bradyrhizobium sp. NBAIM01]|uniref:hypothetical protein n=1 Tax=Bradyrhizobium sp. NBAIM01 TaxID=2793818 RepID=UPI001CD3BCB2|nr:hypothetical protein [Bradyrhizobium sp. NBAIM01]MCA1510272.1 hypothetical protein [Bradyrhizobium sp. NBAIM01]